MSTNAKKNATLGMPYGTASGRLRKIILFDLLKRHQENGCYRCQQPIESVDDLSIEHKLPWEGRSKELFWDLNNIAFSHLKCNVPHVRPGRPDSKFVSPDGKIWCGICKQFLDRELFPANAARWHGCHSSCRNCFNAYRRKLRAGGPTYKTADYESANQG